MANLLLSHPVQAEETPVQEMSFFLFLAESMVDEGKLVTPMDLQDIEISDEDTQASNQEEASHD